MANAHFRVEHFAGRGRVGQRDAVELEIVWNLLGADADRVHGHAERGQLRETFFAQRSAVLATVGDQDDARERRSGPGLHHRVQRVADARLRAGRRHLVELPQRL